MMNEKNTLQCCWSRPRILFLILALLLFSKQTYAQGNSKHFAADIVA